MTDPAEPQQRRWQDGTGLAMGLALGAGLGTVGFDDIGVGTGLGVAIGAAVDAWQRRSSAG